MGRGCANFFTLPTLILSLFTLDLVFFGEKKHRKMFEIKYGTQLRLHGH